MTNAADVEGDLPRRKHKKGQATRAKILRVAEELFAARGLDGVSMRDITSKAEIDLALVNYHFGTKEKLYKDVIARRADVISRARQRALAKLGETAALPEIIDAFFDPLFRRLRMGDEGWRHYGALVGQISNSRRFTEFQHEHLDPTAELFVDAFCRVAPGVERKTFYWAYLLMIGNLVQVLVGTDRLHLLSHGESDVHDIGVAQRELCTYVLGGIEGLIQRSR